MNLPRKHHFVPRCLLRGFADPQTDSGRLFVLDAYRNKVFASSPGQSGHRRDYNLVDPDTHPDSLVVEEFYQKIEDRAGPVLIQMRETRRTPDENDLTKVLDLVAIQYSRTPAFRAWLEGKFFESFEGHIRQMGKTSRGRRRFKEQMRNPGLPTICWTPEGYLSFHKNGAFSTTSDDNWKIALALKSLPLFIEVFRFRRWVLVPFSAANEPLIISDAGVGFLPLGKSGANPVGLARPDTILYLPISPQLVLAGYYAEARNVFDQAVRPRRLNTCSFAGALEQCFSREQDFVIHDPDRGATKWTTYQTEGNFPKLMADARDLAHVYAGRR